MKPLLHRLMVVVVIVAFSFQGASGAMQRLLMPAHYHAVPELDHDTSLVLLAMSDPDAHEEASPELPAHGGPTHLEENHGHKHYPDPLCDHQCERPSHRDPATHQHPPALAGGHTDHVDAEDARAVDLHALAHAHAHAAVLAHRHDRGRQDVVAVAEEVDMPASALRQHGLDGFWSLLPERMVFAVATAQDSVPAFESAPHRALANTAPRRPPRL